MDPANESVTDEGQFTCTAGGARKSEREKERTVRTNAAERRTQSSYSGFEEVLSVF